MRWSPELRLTRADDGGHPVVALVGAVDSANAHVLREELLALYDEGERDAVVDLGGVDLIDSSGLTLLVAALKRYREGGGDVRLRSPTRQLRRILAMTGLSKVFTVEA